MKVILSPLGNPFPCAAAEGSSPVIRFMAIDRILPDVVIAILSRSGFPRLEEPLVEMRCMVDDKVHDHSNPTLMAAIAESNEILECSVIRVDCHVIGDIIAIIETR